MLIVGVLHVGAAVCCSVLQRLARSSRLDSTKYLSWLLTAPSGELIVGVLHVGAALCSSVLQRLARGCRPDSTKYMCSLLGAPSCELIAGVLRVALQECSLPCSSRHANLRIDDLYYFFSPRFSQPFF